jgi:hypothetical protein
MVNVEFSDLYDYIYESLDEIWDNLLEYDRDEIKFKLARIASELNTIRGDY